MARRGDEVYLGLHHVPGGIAMESFLAYLSTDHQRCDDLFAEAEAAAGRRDWAGAVDKFQAFRAAMLRHLEAEESLLFPAFEARLGHTGGPTRVMCNEHAQMRDLLDSMADSVAARDEAEYQGLAETLLWLMRQHNVKEEQILYPMSDQMLADARADLLERMAAVSPA